MATKNIQAAKPSKSVKPASGAKKSAPAKKVVVITKTPAKPAAKPAVANKKASAKPAPKPASKGITGKNPVPVATKKANPIKKPAINNNNQTVNKKTSKAIPVAKKAIPVKKTVPAKKAVPVAKKAAPVAKKAAPAKPVAKAPVKPVAKAAAKPVAKTPAKPVAKPVAITPAKPVAKAPAKPVAKAEPTKPVTPQRHGPAKKKLTVTQMPVKINPSTPRPMATPAARPIDKKPNVVIAHRRLENKSKGLKEADKTMTQYQPETYRSILDEPQMQQGPVYRYSDEELAEFRDIITSRLEAARKELNYLQGLITRKDEAGTEDTENRYMNMEDGSGAMEREQLAQLASRQIQFMSHLEKALVRIENKTYGICRVTGKLIDKARLRAVPHATLSIEAKKLMASKQL